MKKISSLRSKLIGCIALILLVACNSDKLSKEDAKKQIERWENGEPKKRIIVPDGFYLATITSGREFVANLLNSSYVKWEKGVVQTRYGDRSIVQSIYPTEKGRPFMDYDADNKKLIVDFYTSTVEVTSISEASNGLRGVTCRAYYNVTRELNELGKDIEVPLPKELSDGKEITFVKMQDGWKVAYQTGEPIFKD